MSYEYEYNTFANTCCKNSFIYDLKTANFSFVSLLLSGYDWSELYISGCVNNITSVFHHIIYDVIQQLVPTKTVNNHRFSTWFPPELRNFLKRKQAAHKFSNLRKII